MRQMEYVYGQSLDDRFHRAVDNYIGVMSFLQECAEVCLFPQLKCRRGCPQVPAGAQSGSVPQEDPVPQCAGSDLRRVCSIPTVFRRSFAAIWRRQHLQVRGQYFFPQRQVFAGLRYLSLLRSRSSHDIPAASPIRAGHPQRECRQSPEGSIPRFL